MAVMQMQRLNLVAMKQNRKAILKRLQEMGALEIDVKLDKSFDVKRVDTSSDKAVFEKNALVADQALDILNKYVPEKTSLLDSLAGKPLVEHSEYEKTVEDAGFLMEQADSIINCEKEIAKAYGNIQRHENQMEALTPWMGLDIPLDTEGTAKTILFLGMISEALNKEQIQEKLNTKNENLGPVEVTVLATDKSVTYASAICLRKDGTQVEEALREIGFARPSGLTGGIPTEEEENLKVLIEKEQDYIKQLIGQVEAYAKYRTQLKLVSDYYLMKAGRYEVLGTLPETDATFAVSGYIPAVHAQAVAKELEECFGAAVSLEGIGKKEQPPVLLKNNAFSNSVDGVLASYGLPKKGEIDPTTIMSFFYVFLFGLMLSDAAYGAIVAIGCGVLILKFPRMEESLRKALKMFLWCGISTLFWGIMFGGYFGDLVNVITRNYFGNEITIPALWFVPLNDPMRLLIYSLLFGVIHMFVGLALKGYMCLKQKDIKGFVCDVLSWFMFLIGLILILLPSTIFESIAQMDFNFPPFMSTVSLALAVAGALIILVMSGRRKKKKIGLRLALGLYDLYGITSWLSDVLSYSRLLALGLATGVIASVVNQMGSMFGTGVFGTIVFILVFIIGHVFNMAINILGAYVHTNRLQFVEFFGKFYEGGGKPFEPFKAFTKYVDFKKSNS